MNLLFIFTLNVLRHLHVHKRHLWNIPNFNFLQCYYVRVYVCVCVYVCMYVCMCVLLHKMWLQKPFVVETSSKLFVVIRYKLVKMSSRLLFPRILFILRVVEVNMKPLINLLFYSVGLHKQLFPKWLFFRINTYVQ